MTSAPHRTRYAHSAMVCSVDSLASHAGVDMLARGGSAADAAIAASAVLAVTKQDQCGLGGDLLALVFRAGDERPWALNASGRAGSGADPDRLRASGHSSVPVTGDLAAAPVPGCVDGWSELHQRFGRLPMETLLEPARRTAEHGFAAPASLAAAARQLTGVPGGEDFTAAGPLAAGATVRRPGVARALAAIADRGRSGFYGGEFGDALVALGHGEYHASDLARAQADWVTPLQVDAFGYRLWSLAPNSQGYLLLRSAAGASQLALGDPEDPQWAHLLIELSRRAAADRDAVWHEQSDGDALVSRQTLEAIAADLGDRAGHSTAPAAVPGGTVAVCVVDQERTAVSMLQSNFDEWGSKVFVPGTGIVLHSRGASFSLQPGHPAEYGPGRRPPHTLAPTLVTDPATKLKAAVATRGGHIQPQVLLQVLARVLRADQSPAKALAAGRFAVQDGEVWLEGQTPRAWRDGLAVRGHRVSMHEAFCNSFGHAQLILCGEDHVSGASDPRSDTWGVGVL